MKEIEVYTDGACSGNPGAGGWAFLALCKGEVLHKASGKEALTTNNKMELTAAIKALEYIKDQDYKVSIYTDSTYLKNGITQWINSWKKNNWRTSSRLPVKNKDLWVHLDSLCLLKSIDWKWVKAHNGNKYNEYVDKMARKESLS